MPSLRELQARVMEVLLTDMPEATPQHAVALVALPSHAALARLDIYRNNVRTNFADALESTYPAVRRLVGEDYFRQIAREFQVGRPSRSGDLLHTGEFFSHYLSELHAADQFSYLADVARLEWLIQDSLLTAERAPLDLSKLAGVAPDQYESLHFELHAALRLFASRYPVLRIWEANVGSDAEPEVIELGSGADCLAIMRWQRELKFHRLSRGELRLLRALADGQRFANAVDAAAEIDGDFDPAAALQRFVAAGVIVDCR